jgi:hypothetical protein
MIHVSIIVGSKITNPENLRDMVSYAKERNITCEVVKLREDAKGKYLFFYNTNDYYMDYYIHWSFLRLEMPVGYQPDDPDLPEKLYWNHFMVSDGKDVGTCPEEYCDFELRTKNGFKTLVREGGIFGKCKKGLVGTPMFMEDSLRNQITTFFHDRKCFKRLRIED